MSLHFVSGKPGGGKSLYSMSLIEHELLHGQRLVVTNLPIKLPELNDYFQREYPDRVIDLHSRLRILSDQEETPQFWLYRWPSQQIAAVSEESWKAGERYRFDKPVVDVGEVDRGCLFVIDEIHLFFNSREWMNTGKGCLFYLSQHRKLGDDVVAVTQSIGNVDKQFRSLAQDFSYIRNLKKEKKAGFRLPGFFMRSTYSQPFTGQPGVEPMEVRSFRLRPEKLASCYDTAAGVGVLGRVGADTRDRASGLPWWVAIAAVVAVCLGVMALPSLLGRAVKGAVGSTTAQVTAIVTNRPAALSLHPFPKTNLPAFRPPAVVTASNVPPPEPVRLVGHYTSGGRLVCILSDGTERDTGILRVDRNGAVIDGQRFQWARPAAAPAAAAAPPSVQSGGVLRSVVDAIDQPSSSSPLRPRVRVTDADGSVWTSY